MILEMLPSPTQAFYLIPHHRSFMAVWFTLGKCKDKHYTASATVFRFMHGLG